MASRRCELEVLVDRPGDDMDFGTSENVAHSADQGQLSQPVAIVGMHRSGTSMVAKLLQQAGLNLGDDADLMPPAAENPKGFYEHLEFVRLNDEVLNVAGAGWDCPPAAGFDWSDEALDPFRTRARCLAAPLRERLPWGWKDPRTSLTLPFWRSVLGPLRTVVVVRNPLEVVTSLHRRNGFSTALALTLWRIYTERVLEETSPVERLVTHFESYFLDPDREITRVLDFLGLNREQHLPGLKTAAIPALRHHRKSVYDLEEHGFPAEVIDLYLRLRREAGWLESPSEPAVDSPEAVSAGFRRIPSSIALGAGRVNLIRVENEILKQENADYSEALVERETRIAELELALNNIEVLRAALIAEHAKELTHLRGQIAALTERLSESERNREIAEIHERELRLMLTNLQAVQLQRDSEIMGTLGAVLSRYAPNAPAAIYYRNLVGKVRQLVESQVPSGARVLVTARGDEAMLRLGDRATESFPRSTPGVTADYTDIQGNEAIIQLESLRDDGAEFLLVPSSALPWLATHPELERHLEERYAIVARERGVGTIYALASQQGQIPA
jgi:Sulfotransferase family